MDLPPPPPVKVAAGKEQDPVRGRGEWLVFTEGVRDYVEQLERVVPLRGGVVRTALDIGCGVCTSHESFSYFRFSRYSLEEWVFTT